MTTGHYTLWDELRADPVQPLPFKDQVNTIEKMGESLAALKLDPSPNVKDWRRLSDMVNMVHTLCDMGEMLDSHALLGDVFEAMVKASDRYKAGQPLRFDGPGVQAMDALYQDFAAAVSVLPARTMIRCHRLTVKRLQAIRKGQQKVSGRVVAI